jgi:hypothetical protein
VFVRSTASAQIEHSLMLKTMNLQALTRIGEIIDEYQLPAHTVGFGM